VDPSRLTAREAAVSQINVATVNKVGVEDDVALIKTQNAGAKEQKRIRRHGTEN